MKFEAKTVRNTINKAFLKEPVQRVLFEEFKQTLVRFFTGIKLAKEKGEHEEHFKNILAEFFRDVGFDLYTINTSRRIDLAIHTGSKPEYPVGILFETKRPGNSSEMVTKENLNRKAMHEAILYYLEQRIELKNSDLKHIVITDMENWFIFDAQEFERLFYKLPDLRKMWKLWKADRKVSSTNDFIYNEINRYLDESDHKITGLWLPLHKTEKFLQAKDGSDYEKKLRAIYKLFTPIHLLKEPFANDSNSLNKEFYHELLYILGLEETRDGSTRYIQRAEKDTREAGSFIENSIRIIDAEVNLNRFGNSLQQYGEAREEQVFSIAMELCITWINRILFLKLLESQLYRYHRQAQNFKFLNYKTIDGFDELSKLFFQVLARKEKERDNEIFEKFGHIPYLNSSLFEVSEIEDRAIRISNLDDHAKMPVYKRSVLQNERGNKLNTLDYLFRFLEAYDFSAEGSEEIREESKSLINASVLGLIFEKINGYKDGSFYTPGFITEYMARETLRKAVIDKFSEAISPYSPSPRPVGHPPPLGSGDGGEGEKGHETTPNLTLTNIYNRIGRDISIKQANEIINSITICDPAVGSGHFLVSCLNELIAIKSRLGILCDRNGQILRGLEVKVENDELIVSWEDDTLFEYDVSTTWSGNRLVSRRVSKDRDRVQKALFHEKRHLIENCLFGVDINQNSVNICRLRLWIELLKHAYYTEESNFLELEVLPNIVINIKQGNSLVSRFELDADLNKVFKNSKYTVDEYRQAVNGYKKTGDRSEKAEIKKLIDDIVGKFIIGLEELHPARQKLKAKEGELLRLNTQFDMFGDDIAGQTVSQRARILIAEKEYAKQKDIVEKLVNNELYNQAFEWRFEFPEVLDDEGRFTGFDVVIGNPPYVRQEQFKELKPYLQNRYTVYQGTADLYSYFIELGIDLLSAGGYFQFIVANKWMRANYGKPLREWLQKRVNIEAIYDFGDLPVFEEATTYPCLLQLRKTEPVPHFWAANIQTLDFDDLETYLLENRFESGQTRLQPDGWALIDERAQRLLDKLKRKGVPLGEYVDGKIYRGVLTGLNEAFVIDEETKERLIEENQKSKELIKPFLAGKDIKRYQPPNAKNYLILIPSGWTNEKTKEENKWGWFEKSYPAIAKHLSRFEDKARKRYDQGEYWWELRSCTYYDEFEKPKIMLPDISLRGNYTFDNTGGLYLVNTAYIIGNNEMFLLGILASNLIDFYYRSISSTYRGGYLRFIYQYLETIPIVVPDDKTLKQIVSSVHEILETKKENPEADTSNLEEEIDRLVYELYGLSDEDIGVVEGGV